MNNISKSHKLLILICTNLIVLSGIIFFGFLTYKNTTSSINESPKIADAAVLVNDLKDLNVSSRAYIVYDPQARAVVTGKNEYLRFAPASTAKIMAATIALANYPLNKILIARNMNLVEGSKMNLVEGEQMTVRNLLYGMMLPSGNDAAFTIAESFPGGIKSFVNEMNNTAKKLKLDNTHFVDSDGYDDGNYTTAFDLARLAAYAMQNESFANIVKTKQYYVTDTTGNIPHNLKNLNELLSIKGVTGVKTGFTNEAGGVLVTSIENNGKKYIIVVLNTPDRFGDTQSIIKKAVEHLKSISY